MLRRQAYKYELRPTGAQRRQMRRFAGSCRFAFNKALALQKERYEQGEKKLGYAGLCKLLTEWRNVAETPWLADAPVHPLQQALKNLERAYANFFGKWYVSVQTEREVAPPVTQGDVIGIDMGIARFATLSDGTFYAPLNSFKRHETALRKAQQAMSRKTRFSSNWKKAKVRVLRIHARIGHARHDYLHKTSHAIMCVEDLQVRNMSRSASGSIEQPGRHIRARSGLNKAILDQGGFEFRRQLDYKLAWNGGHLIAVPPQYTSQTCPCCGHVSADNWQTQPRFECMECGFEENADVVGAINVLRAGHARVTCEVSGAVMPPAAGTHRCDSGSAQCRA